MWLKCCLSLLLSSSKNTNLIGKEGRKESGGKDKETDWWTKGQKNGQRRRERTETGREKGESDILSSYEINKNRFICPLKRTSRGLVWTEDGATQLACCL